MPCGGRCAHTGWRVSAFSSSQDEAVLTRLGPNLPSFGVRLLEGVLPFSSSFDRHRLFSPTLCSRTVLQIPDPAFVALLASSARASESREVGRVGKFLDAVRRRYRERESREKSVRGTVYRN